jgi:ribonucleoside-diphosphate reductase alpha chain
MSTPSLAHDLALKRTVHTPIELKPHFAWRDVLAGEEIALPDLVLICPHGEERFVLAEVADTLGKALTNVSLAKGDQEIFTDANRAWVLRICRELAVNLRELARNRTPYQLTLNALYELIEKTLVDNNAYFVAKSLLLNRARKLSFDREATAQTTFRVIRRNNQVVPWNEQKVEIAIRKTFLSLQRDSAPAVAITRAVGERVQASKQAFLHIEEIQDLVQEELMKAGHYKVAEAYILFRAERASAREHGTPDLAPPPMVAPEQGTMVVVKQENGDNTFWDGADLRKRIEFARIGLDLCLSNDQIEVELRRSIYDQISQKDLDATIVLNSKTLIERDADFSKFAGRIQLTYLYEEILGWNIMQDGIGKLKEFHQRAFRKYLEHGVAIKRLNPRLLEYDIARLAAALDPSSDLEFDFLGIQTLYDRYLIVDKIAKPSKRIETPQFFWLRVAMGLFLDEKGERETKVAALYSLYKTRRFCSSTPTLFNSGTLHSQLSSCYLYLVDDSIEGIFQRGISENAYLAKWAGGLGGSWTPVRGTGAYIGGTNGESQGVIPFLKLHNDLLCAVNQCFAGDTVVHTADGPKPIVDVKTGDLVLGHSGTYRAVTEKFAYEQRDPMVAVKIKHSLTPIKVTAGHPFYAIQGVPLEQDNARTMRWLAGDKVKADWVDAGKLERGDYVAQVIPTQIIPVAGFSEDDARLYGILLGDGHLSKNERQWGVSGHPGKDAHLEFVRAYLTKRGVHFWETGRGETYIQIHWAAGFGAVRDGTTGRIVGGGASTMPFGHGDLYDENGQKRISRRFAHLPLPQTEALIQGLIETDGGVSRQKEIYFSSSSRALAEGIRYQLLRLGIPSGGQFRRRDHTHQGTRSDGSTIEFNGFGDCYDVRIPAVMELAALVGIRPIGKRNWLTYEGCVFTRVREVRAIAPEAFVFDLKVEGDETYMTSAALVHNGGKRRGSGCAYLETWHNDIFEFLELRKNTGDDRRRTHDMNTANWIPDLFMKRVEARKHWTLFRSNEVKDLHELYGKRFEEKYVQYEKQAEAGKIFGQKIEALDLWKKMLSMLFETGHPWITFKDACNLRSPQDHVGVIHSSNLCCMTADQRVVTAEGLVTVGYLFEQARKLALVDSSGNGVLVDEAANTVFGRSGPVAAGPMLLPRPDAPIVRIRTKEGYSHKVTPDHKVWVVGRGWVEAQALRRGDFIELQPSEGLWGSANQTDAAFLCGMIAGDGTFMHHRDGSVSVCVDVWSQEYGLIPEIEAAIARILEAAGEQARTTSSLEPVFAGDEYKRRLSSAPLARVLAKLGFSRETKLKVPEFVWRGDRETAAAYLRGLYAADATVESSGEVTTCSLASVSEAFLEEIQILLANFGIKSSLTQMRERGLAELPDGCGGTKEYWQNALWRLAVMSIRGCRILENLTGIGRLRGNGRFLSNLEKAGYAQKMFAAFEALEVLPNEDAYCLQVFTEEHSWTVNGLITKNTEITLNTSSDETAVCNLGSIILDSHLLPDGNLDHKKLRETIRTAVRALDNVIDINFYPTEAARRANLRHRPIGLGLMGLANTLYLKGIAFASPEAVDFNDEAMEAVAYYAYEASSDLAAERGTYSSYHGSKWDRGLLPQDSLELLEQERGIPVDVPRSSRMDWAPVRAKIAAQGMRNSNVLAIAPTATISNITNTSPCIEPTYKNLFVKSNLSGEFIVLNPFLVKDLKGRSLWDQDMIDSLKYFDGELKDIERIPADLKAKYLTAFDIDPKWIVDAAARRQKWIDQSQSVNLWIKTPDLKALSHMYRHAWHAGLKTTYYLRSLGASTIEKATVAVKKDTRGAVKEGTDGGQNSGDAGGTHQPGGAQPTADLVVAKKIYSAEEKTACSIEAMRNGGECEACQ